jgi:hypothetical protein
MQADAIDVGVLTLKVGHNSSPNPDKPELKICGIASGFAFGYDPTGRFVFSNKIDRIP